jgi:hypothetical protein
MEEKAGERGRREYLQVVSIEGILFAEAAPTSIQYLMFELPGRPWEGPDPDQAAFVGDGCTLGKKIYTPGRHVWGGGLSKPASSNN